MHAHITTLDVAVGSGLCNLNMLGRVQLCGIICRRAHAKAILCSTNHSVNLCRRIETTTLTALGASTKDNCTC